MTSGSEARLVLLDASVLVAAARSPSGGSAVAMEACSGTRFKAAVTNKILLEARVNIAEKFGEAELVRFYNQLAALDPEMAPPPSAELAAACAPLTDKKDVHVLAAALQCGAAYLLTLDHRHLLTPSIQTAGLPFQVMTPGDFLQGIVPQE